MKTKEGFARLTVMIPQGSLQPAAAEEVAKRHIDESYTYRGPGTMARCRKETMINDLDTGLQVYRPTVVKL